MCAPPPPTVLVQQVVHKQNGFFPLTEHGEKIPFAERARGASALDFGPTFEVSGQKNVLMNDMSDAGSGGAGVQKGLLLGDGGWMDGWMDGAKSWGATP